MQNLKSTFRLVEQTSIQVLDEEALKVLSKMWNTCTSFESYMQVVPAFLHSFSFSFLYLSATYTFSVIDISWFWGDALFKSPKL